MDTSQTIAPEVQPSAPDAEQSFVCGSDERFRFACKGAPFYKEKGGVQYCLYHYPGEEKAAEFSRAVKRRLTHARTLQTSFRGFWFPERLHLSDDAFSHIADFSFCTFKDGVYFGAVAFNAGARFIGSRFESMAMFTDCTFKGDVHFNRARFADAYFTDDSFEGGSLYFNSARFGDRKAPDKGATFDTEFGTDVSFRSARFLGNAYFRCVFKKGVSFRSTKFRANLMAYGTKFEGDINFYLTICHGETSFGSAEFARKAEFTSTEFRGETSFLYTRFADDADFSLVKFGGPAQFNSAEFGREVLFYYVQFEGKAEFNGANFGGETRFNGPTFQSSADFTRAVFNSRVVFQSFRFKSWAIFHQAVFKESVRFIGSDSSDEFNRHAQLSFDHAYFDKLEQVSFERVALRPSALIGIDPRKFDFSGVKWHNLKPRTYKVVGEIIFMHDIAPDEPLSEQLNRTCRYLAENAETNHRYAEASHFRYWSMDAARLGSAAGFNIFKFNWWYWLASGYGEKASRAFVVMLLVWLGFAYVYSQVDCMRLLYFDRMDCLTWSTKKADGSGNVPLPNMAQQAPSPEAERMDFKKAVLYSLGVMSLQKPDDPTPVSWLTKALVMLEAILGPVQIALLALAVRRQFMR